MAKKFTTHIDHYTGSISTMEPYAVRVGSTVVTEEDLEDLVTLIDVLKNMPDDHPLAELKKDLQARKAFAALGDTL